MTELQKRMIECLQLRGLSERTQDSYITGLTPTQNCVAAH